MKQYSYEEGAANAKAAVEADLANANAALKSNDNTKYQEALTALKDSIELWNGSLRKVAFDAFCQEDDPLKAAIRTFYCTSWRAKEVKPQDSDTVTSITLAKNDNTRIDVEKFVEFVREHYGNMGRKWLYDCDRLLIMLQNRKSTAFGGKPAVEMETAGYSNTAICKLLQEIVDATIFEDNGNGLNVHKVTKHDIDFIEDACHQFDPKVTAGLKSLKQRGFKTVMMSVLHAMLTGEGYAVKNYKVRLDESLANEG